MGLFNMKWTWNDEPTDWIGRCLKCQGQVKGVAVVSGCSRLDVGKSGEVFAVPGMCAGRDQQRLTRTRERFELQPCHATEPHEYYIISEPCTRLSKSTFSFGRKTVSMLSSSPLHAPYSPNSICWKWFLNDSQSLGGGSYSERSLKGTTEARTTYIASIKSMLRHRDPS